MWLRETYGVQTFIETGTYQGGTTAWASGLFEQVITIEGSADFHRAAREKYAHRQNVDFLFGDSITLLPEALARTGGRPAILWLDAHWMPGSYGSGAECPVLQEIEAVNRSSAVHFLLIDDARLFMAPPPRPHRAADWPDLGALLAVLSADSIRPRYTTVYDDVIICVPETAREAMRNYLQERITTEFKAGAVIAPTGFDRIKHYARRQFSELWTK